MAGPWEKYQKQQQPAEGPWAKYKAQKPQPSPEPQSDQSGYGSQIFSGLLEGATGALGAPVDLMNNLVVKPATMGINAVFGTDIQPSSEPLGGSSGLRQGLAIDEQSGDGGHQVARRVAQSVGGAAVPAFGSANTARQIAAMLATGAGGGVGGAAAQQLLPDNVGAEIAGELLGGIGTGGVIAGVASRQARKAAEAGVPTIEQLKDQASGLYKRAENNGIAAGAVETRQLADDVTQIAKDNALITPTGRVSTAYPKAKEALDLMQDYSGYDMNPMQMQVVRETLADAAHTTQGKERRIASMILGKFDDFTSPLAPELQQARSVSQRYMKAQQLKTMQEVAESKATGYSQSGYENTLRKQYESLNTNIIKGSERGWGPAEQAAIRQAAEGTPLSRAMVRAGKAAPTGAVSAMGGVGVPFLIGNAFGGPQMGAIASALVSGGGLAAKGAATSMRSRYADLADLTVRNGGAVKSASQEAIRRKIIEALLGAQAASQSGRQQ